MLPYHKLPEHLAGRKGTVAYFARQPKRKLMMFVHGFGGSAIGTWDPMHEILPMLKRSDGWDLVFYEYRSLRPAALNSANMLRQFIDDLTKSQSRKMGGDYTNVLVVAHSLGALITRRCMLDAHTLGRKWAPVAELLLFGPAHCGATAVALGNELLSSFGPLGATLAAVFQLGAPVLRDLDPNSTFVADLIAKTNRALAKHAKAPLVAKRVLFGLNDQVVQARDFCSDPPSDTIPGQGHMNVCRPRAPYRQPLKEVVRLL